METSILSHPPNTQCAPKGSLASSTVIGKFPRVVQPLGNGSGRKIQSVLGVGGWAVPWFQQRASNKWMDGWAIIHREKSHHQEKNPGCSPWEPFLFFFLMSNFEKLVPIETKQHIQWSGFSKSDLCMGHVLAATGKC